MGFLGNGYFYTGVPEFLYGIFIEIRNFSRSRDFLEFGYFHLEDLNFQNSGDFKSGILFVWV